VKVAKKKAADTAAQAGSMVNSAQASAEKQANTLIDSAKEMAAKVSETVQTAVGNLVPGEKTS
jgi:hypothetical protein